MNDHPFARHPAGNGSFPYSLFSCALKYAPKYTQPRVLPGFLPGILPVILPGILLGILQKIALLVLGVGIGIIAPPSASAQDELNLYSARAENLIRPLIDDFTAKTGVRVNTITAKADALLKRLESEGKYSPADLLLTIDAGRLHRAVETGLVRAFEAGRFERVPLTYRDADNHWIGLSLRARPIMYVADRVNPADLSTYEELAAPKWQGRICIRSSNNIYNQSLVASMIDANGKQSTRAWLQGFVNNFARPPKGGDRDQIKAAVHGVCDIAIANTYYLAGMLQSKDPSERAIAEKMRVFWPNQPKANQPKPNQPKGDRTGRGVHVNISGVVLLKSAKNIDAAHAFVEFLLSNDAQQWYADANGEYPVIPEVQASAVLQRWGTFKADDVPLSTLGVLNSDAVYLMDSARWR